MRKLLMTVPGALLLASCVGSVGDGAEAPGEPGEGPSAPGTPGETGRAGAQPGGAGGAGGPLPSGGAPPAPASAGAASFACTPGAVPPVQGWRRLTVAQYRNTLRDLVTVALKGDANQAGAVLGTVSAALGRIPLDERQKLPQDLHGSYRRLDQDVEQVHVDGFYEVALGIGAALGSPTRLRTVVGSCATDADTANDDACLTAFIQSFGERALRRPLAADEVAFYRGFHGAGTPIDPAGIADLIAALLVAPQFLYHLEHGEAPAAGKANVFTLTAHELAARLSYHFWDTMPDADLLASARGGALRTPEGLAQQIERLFADPRARASFDEFYRDWLKLEDLSAMDLRNFDPLFKAFAGDDLPRSSLRQQMIEDALALVRHYTWDRQPATPGTFDDLLSSSLSFAKGAELAKIYGVPAWPGAGEPPAFPPDLRPGLLTRAAFLATGSANTRPVMKGVFAREYLLCDEIPPPPDNANASPPELSNRMSTRQVVEAVTEQPNTACAGCHSTLINPIGYATENFDALGRLRTDQRLFSDKGVETGRAPVDTRSVPQVVLGDRTPSAGAADLMKLIARSGKAHACFVRNYFRYTFGRWEDLGVDGCVLERVRRSLADRGGSLRAALREVALAPEFRERRL